MKWSWRVGRVAGIDIKIHVTFVFALAWGAFMWGGRDLAGLPYGAALTVALFAVVLMHELGHSLAAQRYGIAVQDIVLLPIGGVARLARMPEKPVQELVVALAGPAVNVFLLILLLPFVLTGAGQEAIANAAFLPGRILQSGLAGLAAFLVVINVWLLLFNMIPAFPMDGGRVLRALLALRLPYERATIIAALVGRVLAILFAVVGILTANFTLPLVALFVFYSAGAESAATSLRERLRGVTVTDVVDADAPVLSPDLPARIAFDRLVRSPYPALAVLSGSGDFVGVVTREGLQRRWTQGLRGTVEAFTDRPRVTLECATSLEEATEQMAEVQAPIAPVFCGGRFAGLLDIGAAVRAATARRKHAGREERRSVV